MQTITRKLDDVSVYLFNDSEKLVYLENGIEVGSPVYLAISDLNDNNSNLFVSDDVPVDWNGEKYKYDGVVWSENPDYVIRQSTPAAE